jgi:predicted transcriptional regulator
MKKNSESEKMLTDTELELMTILWKLGEGSVADVIDNLSRVANKGLIHHKK